MWDFLVSNESVEKVVFQKAISQTKNSFIHHVEGRRKLIVILCVRQLCIAILA